MAYCNRFGQNATKSWRLLGRVPWTTLRIVSAWHTRMWVWVYLLGCNHLVWGSRILSQTQSGKYRKLFLSKKPASNVGVISCATPHGAVVPAEICYQEKQVLKLKVGDCSSWLVRLAHPWRPELARSNSPQIYTIVPSCWFRSVSSNPEDFVDLCASLCWTNVDCTLRQEQASQ